MCAHQPCLDKIGIVFAHRQDVLGTAGYISTIAKIQNACPISHIDFGVLRSTPL